MSSSLLSCNSRSNELAKVSEVSFSAATDHIFTQNDRLLQQRGVYADMRTANGIIYFRELVYSLSNTDHCLVIGQECM